MVRKTFTFAAWCSSLRRSPAPPRRRRAASPASCVTPAAACMPGVTVTATHDATNAVTTAVSNEVGLYVLRGLPVGRYSVVAELPGFQTAKNTDIVVRVNEDVRLDIGLKVGAVTDTVTVSGMASTVDTTTGTLKTIVDQERIENLPLNGRNATQLMTLVAGVLTDRTDLTSGATYPGTPAGVVERRARQHHELRARRRVEQRSLHQRPEPDAESGRAAGVQRADQQLQRRVRAERRRHRQCGDPRRHQPVPRPGLRLLPSLQVQRDELLHARASTTG